LRGNSYNMNKKGQVFGTIVLLIGFFLFYFLFGYNWLTDVSLNMIEVNNLSGIEAFLIANMNIWVLLGVFMSSMLMMFFGGSS
jgi:hypothetical protein